MEAGTACVAIPDEGVEMHKISKKQRLRKENNPEPQQDSEIKGGKKK